MTRDIPVDGAPTVLGEFRFAEDAFIKQIIGHLSYASENLQSPSRTLRSDEPFYRPRTGSELGCTRGTGALTLSSLQQRADQPERVFKEPWEEPTLLPLMSLHEIRVGDVRLL